MPINLGAGGASVYLLPLAKTNRLMKDSIWNQVLTYFYLRKRDPNAPKTLDLKFMHGMNRISLFMFLFAVIVMIVRLFRH